MATTELTPEEQAQVDEFELEVRKQARKIRFKDGDKRTLDIRRYMGQQPNEKFVGKTDWVFEAADIELDPNDYKLWPTTISTARKVMEYFKAGKKLLRITRKGSGLKDTEYLVDPVPN
jgi:hypothetical protein